MNPDGGSAYPHVDINLSDVHTGYQRTKGMTLRQWYKGRAISGLASDHDISVKDGIEIACNYAEQAIKEDETHLALLAERGE